MTTRCFRASGTTTSTEPSRQSSTGSSGCRSSRLQKRIHRGGVLALQRRLDLEILVIASDGEHRGDLSAHAIHHGGVPFVEAAEDLRIRLAAGMTDVRQGDVVVLAPEERHVAERTAEA